MTEARNRTAGDCRTLVTAAALLSLLALTPLQVSAQTPEEVRGDVLALTAPGTDGRAVGTPGAAQARRYLIGELAATAARPLPGRDQFGIPFAFVARVTDIGSMLRAGGHKRFASDQVRAFAFSETGEVRGELHFAGYGIRLPEGTEPSYDSYAGQDVRDKVVVALRYFPDGAEGEERAAFQRHSGLRDKVIAAREAGAAGLVIVTGPLSPNPGEFAPDGFDIAAPGGQGLVAVSVDGAAAEGLFAGSGRDLADVQRELDGGSLADGAFPLPGFATLSVDLERERGTGANVVGILPAADGSYGPPWIAVGAHYDHLGSGGSGSLNPHGSPEIHPGADDNASGTAAVLALARRVSETPLARPLLVAFWSGEESGLLGSTAFVRDEIGASDILAYINLDMVGRLEENRLSVQALGSSSIWPGVVERANVPAGFDLALSDDPYLPTDSSAFNSAGVPTLNLFTGTHPDYHTPADTADKLNYEGLARVGRFAWLVARRVADLEDAPDFVRVERDADQVPARSSMSAYTGTIPEYATEIEGLLLGGVMAGGPAEAAGLRAGDVIVEFAGAAVGNIYDYMNALGGVRIGVSIEVVYLRDGERFTTTLTPTARP